MARPRLTEIERQKREDQRYLRQLSENGTTKGTFVMLVRPREPTPQHVLDDWEYRQNAPDTIHSLLLGDPTTPRWASNAR